MSEIVLAALLFGAYPLSILFTGSGSAVLSGTFLVAVALLSSHLFTGRKRKGIAIYAVIVGLFLAYLLFNATYISTQQNALRIFVRTLFLMIAAAALATAFFDDRKSWIIHGILAATALAIFLYLNYRYGRVRAASFFSDDEIGALSNWIPALLVPVLPIVLERLKHRMFDFKLIATAMAMVIVMVLSQSRFSMVISAVAAVLIFVDFRRMAASIQVILLMAVTTVAAIYLLDLDIPEIYANILDRFEDRSMALNGEIRESIREEMLATALDLWRANPFFGIGLNGMADVTNYTYGGPVISHNLYLVSGLGEFGAVGFLLVLLLTGYPILRQFNRYRRLPAGMGRSQEWAVLIGLLIAAGHAYFRPQLDNPVFFIFLLHAGMPRLIPSISGFTGRRSQATGPSTTWAA